MFFDTEYQIDRSLVRLTHQEEISHQSQQLQKYMDVINSDLEVSISKNFDFFNRAFSHFDCIKEDMK